MLLAQITDTHVRAKDAGLYKGFDTAGDLARAVATLNGLDPQPDAVILTGDLVDKRSAEEYAHIAEILTPLKAPLYIVPGNHDARSPLEKVLKGLVRFGEDGGFMQGAIDVEDEHGPLRLLLVDTLMDREVGGHLCTERLSWIENRLSEARDTPTLIAMHHPPMHVGIPIFDGFGFEGMEAFRALIEQHAQVDLILCGHIHRPITGRLGSAIIKVAPSPSFSYPLELRPGHSFGPVPAPTGIALHWRAGPRDWVSHQIPTDLPA